MPALQRRREVVRFAPMSHDCIWAEWKLNPICQVDERADQGYSPDQPKMFVSSDVEFYSAATRLICSQGKMPELWPSLQTIPKA